MSTNWLANSLFFILVFWPHSGLLAIASTILAKPICILAGLLTWQTDRRANWSEHNHYWERFSADLITSGLLRQEKDKIIDII